MAYLVVTVDVEPDSPEWGNITEFKVENIPSLERLQAICDRYGVPPTYLTSYSVACNPKSARVLERLVNTMRCEIGAHLHPSETPPDLPGRKLQTSIPHLPPEVKEAKLRNLDDALRTRFGPPKVFRAGRYRIDAATVRILESLGYSADTSITPHVSWVLERGPRWSVAPEKPYRMSREDPGAPGESSIIEIPITIREGRKVPRWGVQPIADLFSMPFASLPGPLFRLIESVRPIRPLWLRPTYLDSRSLISLVDRVLAEGDDAVLNMMFHSNELAPGMSPFVRSIREAELLLERVEDVCRHAVAQGAIPLTLSAVARIVDGRIASA